MSGTNLQVPNERNILMVVSKGRTRSQVGAYIIESI